MKNKKVLRLKTLKKKSIDPHPKTYWFLQKNRVEALDELQDQ